MLANNRLSVEVQLFVDGKHVTNFFTEQVQLIEPNSPQEIKSVAWIEGDNHTQTTQAMQKCQLC